MEKYFEIGIYQPKRYHNIGTLWRSSLQLGANAVFTIGRRYKYQTSDTFRTGDNIPQKYYLTFQDFLNDRDPDIPLIGIEMGGTVLSQFEHPARAIYLLGAEDNGLPDFVLEKCDRLVSLEAVKQPSYNVAVTGSIVLYHRQFLSSHS
ncbi:MAG TPA: TrmH family RNA methyltransferase [Chloroflexia bacterium]|nr:TrmH family RNA methyltransferase [Chloroflexia bacterium]